MTGSSYRDSIDTLYCILIKFDSLVDSPIESGIILIDEAKWRMGCILYSDMTAFEYA